MAGAGNRYQPWGIRSACNRASARKGKTKMSVQMEIAREPNEQVTMSVKLMESLLAAESAAAFERGAIEGMNRVTSLSLDYDDNSTQASLHIITAKTRRALSLEIKN